MKDRPILMNGAMVRATLAGTKSQTRRIVKLQELSGNYFEGGAAGVEFDGFRIPREGGPAPAQFSAEAIGGGAYMSKEIYCPYGQPGDRLWVRETWRGVVGINPPGATPEYGVARYVPDQEHCHRVEYAATQECDSEPWRPSIHMPRWASRILLEIVSVRVERLNDCSAADARAEGLISYEHFWRECEYPLPDVAYEPFKASPTRYSDPVQAYQALWESINGAGSWAANPWVWVVEFKRVTP